MGNFIDEQMLVEINNLPSERWKIRRIRTAYDRELRRLHREEKRVRELIQNLGYEELNPPIQRGYKRLFVLTEETKRQDNAELYQSILDKINTVWYSPVKTFKRDKKRKISKWKYRKKEEQSLREIELSSYIPKTYDWFEYAQKSHHMTEEQLRFFSRVDYYNHNLKRWCVKLVFNESFRFVLRVRPNIITKVERKDLVLEQYHNELDKRLDRNWGRVVKVLHGGHTNAWNTSLKKHTPKEKYRDCTLKNKPLHEIMEQYKEEKQLWEYEPKI